MILTQQDENETNIKTLVEGWAKAVREENLDQILANHDQNILMFDVPGPLQSKGLSEYEKTWELYFSWSQHSGVFDISELKITVDDNLAFCTGIIHCAGKEATGKSVEYEVRLTICLAKINDEWVIMHEHHSVPGV